MALFGPSAIPANKNLLEIKAGQVVISENKATPNKEKGLIYLKTGTDQLVHFCWQNRDTKHTLEDFTIIPGDAVFKNIQACKTGRIYALFIPSSKSKHLYWLQEPNKDKDKEAVEKMNQILSNPAPAPESERGHNMMDMLSSLRSSDMFEGVDPSLIDQLLQGSGPNSLRQIMSMSDPLTRGAAAGAAASRNLFGSGGSQSENNTPSNQPGTNQSSGTSDSELNSEPPSSIGGMDIHNLVSGIQLPQSLIDQHTPARFTDVLTTQALESVLSDTDSVARLEALLPDSPEPLRDLFTSPQFAQAIGFFSEGFLSGQLAPLMNEYGNEAVTAARNADLVGLARAIETRLGVEQEIVDEDVIGEGEDIVDDSDELD